jgi:hypothetical protein
MLAGCAGSAQQTAMARQQAQARLSGLIAGKVAGAPRSCLPSYRADDMIVIDDNVIAFRDGPNRVWLTKPNGACSLLSSPGYALVTRNFGGLGLCSGDIGQVLDTTSRMTVGSCVMGEFTPYERPGG